jgi:hypothetical protein
MKNIIIALCFFVISACASDGPLKMYSGSRLSDDASINITIPAGIGLHRVDGKGGVIGYYKRNKVFMGDFRDRQITLLPGQHTIEFFFRVLATSKRKLINSIKGETSYNISFYGEPGRKYRLAFEAVSCSNDTVDMAVMIHEQQEDAAWKKLTNTDIDIKVKIEMPSSIYSFERIEETDLKTELNDKEEAGYVIFSRKALPDLLGIVPFESYNFVHRRDTFTDNIFDTGITYYSMALGFDRGEKLSIFRLPAGKYLTFGFFQSYTTSTTSPMPGSYWNSSYSYIGHYPYCSKIEVLPDKYIYLGRVDYDLSTAAFTVLDNSKKDLETVREYYPKLTSDQVLVDILTPEK